MANHWSALQFPPATAEVIRERLDVMHEQELERGNRGDAWTRRARSMCAELLRAVVDGMQMRAGPVGGGREFLLLGVANAEPQKPGVRDVIRYSRWGAMYLNYDCLVTRI